jgi:hypothetical protein
MPLSAKHEEGTPYQTVEGEHDGRGRGRCAGFVLGRGSGLERLFAAIGPFEVDVSEDAPGFNTWWCVYPDVARGCRSMAL